MIGSEAGPEEELKKDGPAKFKHSQDCFTQRVQIYTDENSSFIPETRATLWNKAMHVNVNMLYQRAYTQTGEVLGIGGGTHVVSEG